MAIYHCSIKNIGRSGGRSAVAASAYRSGGTLTDHETGEFHDYSKKGGIEYTAVILCKNAPEKYRDREVLWNAVQKIEKAGDARLAREWEVAIPRELTLEQGQQLVRDFGQSLADEGMCVDIAIHDKGDGNRHAHILGTTRPIKENGEWGIKEKKAYALDEAGNKIPIIDPETGLQKVRVRKGKGEEKLWQRVTVAVNDWNKKEKVEEWRERWAQHCNRYLAPEQHIDHRSYERQGIDREPTIHEGYVARQMEKDGRVSDRCQINRDVAEYNALTQTETQLIRERLSLLDVLRKAKEAIYERLRKLQQLRSTRSADGAVGRNANGNQGIEASARTERVGNLQFADGSNAVSRGTEYGTEPGEGIGSADNNSYIGEIIRSARAAIDDADAREKNSAASRADREAARERSDLAKKQRAAARTQRSPSQGTESREQSSRDRGDR